MTNVRLPVDIQNRILEFTHKCENCGLVSGYNKVIPIKWCNSDFVFCETCCTFNGAIGNPVDMTKQSFCDYYNIHIDETEGDNLDLFEHASRVAKYDSVYNLNERFRRVGINILIYIAYTRRRGNIIHFSVSVTDIPGAKFYRIHLKLFVQRK